MGITAMLWILSFVLSLSSQQGFRASLTVEERGQKADYIVYFKKGVIRVEPQNEEEIFLLVDIKKRMVTIVETPKRIYYPADIKGFADLRKAKLVRGSWFPWVYQVGQDLVDEAEVRERGPVALANGTRGRKTDVYSPGYDKVVAEYWLDPRVEGNLFFQWQEVYFDFWSESDELDDAQRARFEIYDQLKGLPRRMEERFRLLTQPRILAVEEWGPAEENSWSVPPMFTEKSVAQLIWEDLIRRFEKWLRPKGLPE
jgi:hypothetical protein